MGLYEKANQLGIFSILPEEDKHATQFKLLESALEALEEEGRQLGKRMRLVASEKLRLQEELEEQCYLMTSHDFKDEYGELFAKCVHCGKEDDRDIDDHYDNLRKER